MGLTAPGAVANARAGAGIDGSRRMLAIYPEKCTGCRRCEMACSWRHTATYDVAASRIRCQGDLSGPIGPLVCQHCQSPSCARVCPTGALSRATSGAVAIEYDSCLNCGLCTVACPYGGVFHSSSEGRVIKCDHCGGDPSCVQACPTGALEYMDSVSPYRALISMEDITSPGLTMCLGCCAELALRVTLRALGKNTILGVGPGCISAAASGFGATMGVAVPVVMTLLDNYASMMGGVKRFYQYLGRDVQVVCFAGDGGTGDIGFQSLSAAAERGENLIYICYDNEAYMNTGIQRSGSTPRGAWTMTTPVAANIRGKPQQKKDVPMLMANHHIPYVATASMAHLDDFLMKLRKAMAVRDGMSYIHVLSPCPTGWRFPTEKTLEVNRLAVETNYFPLWECDYRQFRITREVLYPRPVEAYTQRVGKFAHLNRVEIQEIQDEIDRRFDRLRLLSWG